MKLITSGVEASAAQTKSPSFSRSSSSATITVSPRAIAAMAASTEEKRLGMRLNRLAGVRGDTPL
jgi:hypothetical protein